MSGNGWAYIGRTTKPDDHWPIVGTAVCVVVDEREMKPEKEIGKWLRDGLTIQRVPTEWVREHFMTADPYPYVPASDHGTQSVAPGEAT